MDVGLRALGVGSGSMIGILVVSVWWDMDVYGTWLELNSMLILIVKSYWSLSRIFIQCWLIRLFSM